jgi:G:T-mismatch repair DNA endonuclease (very short patch repair protein)
MLRKNADGLYECAICHAGYDNVGTFSLHISCGHKKSSQEYYDEYCREEGEGVCKVCGQPTKFRSLGEGYKDTCSHKCGSILLKRDPAKMAAKKAKTEATCLERYGVTNGGGSKEALEKAQKTNMERRGVAWNMQSREVVEKSKATCMDKYGSTTYVHGAEGTARVEATVMERFGRENFFSGKEGHAAASAGMMAKHGVDNAMHSPEIIERRSAAEREKYGGKLFVQTEEFKERSRATQEASYGTWYSASPEGRARYRGIMLGRHGVPEYFQSEEFKSKSRATLQATRGVDNISQTQEWHDKVTATSMEKYGVPHFTKSDSVKAKSRETNMVLYGSPNYATSEVFHRRVVDKYISRVAEFGCEILSVDARSHVTFRCNACGNVSTEQPQFIKRRTDEGLTPCPHCHRKNNPISLEETGLVDFVKSLGVEVKHYDRDFLGTYGADIVVDTHKVIIEYDGIFWHSELFKDNNYHLEKKLLAEEKGYRLIHVFSDEWLYKRSIVESRLRYLFGAAGLARVYARDCQVQPVAGKGVAEFLEENHIQGAVKGRWSYGLYSGGRLVSIMTFGMSRFERDTVELLRFCSARDVNVVGAAGKLFSHFVDEHPEVTGMTSYADARWSTGDAFYTKLGFTLDSMSSPGYFIVDGDIRRNRMQFQRHKIAGPGDEGKTEHEITLERGLFRIYDCGQYKYRWTRLTKEA